MTINNNQNLAVGIVSFIDSMLPAAVVDAATTTLLFAYWMEDDEIDILMLYDVHCLT